MHEQVDELLKVKTIVDCQVRILTGEDVGRSSVRNTRRGKKKAIFTPKGGLDLGAALARSAGAGMVDLCRYDIVEYVSFGPVSDTLIERCIMCQWPFLPMTVSF
jgi:hypothetical protein